MEGKQIANLFATLGFQVNEKGLTSFMSKLAQMETRLAALKNKTLTFTVGKPDTTKLKGELQKALGGTKIKLSNFQFGVRELRAVKKSIDTALGNITANVKHINVQNGELNAAKVQIAQRLSTAEARITKVEVTDKAIKKASAAIRSALKVAPTVIDDVSISVKKLNQQLSAWRKKVHDDFTVKIRAEVHAKNLVSSLRHAVNTAQQSVGVIKLKTPNVQVGVDKQHLKAEIANALAQIKRDLQLNINLNATARGGGSLHSAGSPSESRRRMIDVGTGGAIGAGMGLARGMLPGLGAGWAFANLNRINQEIQGSQIALEAVSGTPEDAQSNVSFLHALGKEQGKTFRDLAQPYTNILASSRDAIGTQGTQDMYRGILKYATVMNLDQEALKGSLRAIGQMFSKDKIQAEEAQGQFAERMPAGMQLLAQAYGTSVKDLREAMKDGKLDPKKIIPELGRIMENFADSNGRYQKALETTRVQQGRFNYQFEQSVKLFADSGFDKAMASWFDTMRGSLAGSTELIEGLGEGFKFLTAPAEAAMNLIRDFSDYLPTLAKNLGLSKGATLGLMGAFLMNLTPLGRVVSLISVLTLAIEDLVTWYRGGDSVFEKLFEGLSPERQSQLIAIKDSIEGIGNSVGNLIDKLTSLLSKLVSSDLASTIFDTIINKIQSTIKTLQVLLDAIDKATSGDFSGAVQNLRSIAESNLTAAGGAVNTVGAGFNNAVDAVLPGTPLNSTLNWLGTQTPAAQQAQQAQEAAQRRANYEATQGTNKDVPKIENNGNNIHINVNGAGDPQAAADAIEKKLNSMFNLTAASYQEIA